MRESKTLVALDRPQMARATQRYSDDFKQDAVRLIVEEKYSFKAAAVGGRRVREDAPRLA